jgi:enoyl-CoA hydratase
MYERYKFLKFERRGKILTVTMDNPSANAANFGLHDELSYVFDEIEHDAECEVVVLTGTGRVFSAGADRTGRLKACDNSSVRASMISRAPNMVSSLLSMSKPVIARVNGHARGLGALQDP